MKESRRQEIRSLTPNQLFDIVCACFWVYRHDKEEIGEANELMYLIEPHILKNFQEYTPLKLGKIANYYFACKQGSIDFLRQIIAVSALLSDQNLLRQNMILLTQIRYIDEFKKETKLILERSIMKNVPQLSQNDIRHVL